MSEPVAVILAAGQGTRMKSDLPKVLHPANGRPLVEHVITAVREAGVGRIIVVVGYRADQVRQALAGQSYLEFVLQSEQKGTGHAVQMCGEALAEHDGPVLILAGDMPLVRASSLKKLLDLRNEADAACVIGTARTEANAGLGRIVRDDDGTFLRIVEERDASPEEKRITEINTGCYVFDCRPLLEAITQIDDSNDQGELYLTDCPAVLREAGYTVLAAPVMTITEAMGVNTPEQLAQVERTMRQLAERGND